MASYPARNTIFEDTQIAVLYQDRGEAGEVALGEPLKVAALMNRFFSPDESDEREFHRAMEEFKSRIPDLAQSLSEHIKEAHAKNPKFRDAFAVFMTLCRASLNPELSTGNVDEMLMQHLLTERLMRNLFQNSEFTKRNVIAAQVQNVIAALASGSFSTAEFLKKLDPYYTAIERAGDNISHFTEKQDFLNSVYEQFFQRFSPDVADTHGIVYTPREIVDYMCSAVEAALQEEFGYTLASPEVVDLARKLYFNQEAEQRRWMMIHQDMLDQGDIENLVPAIRSINSPNPELAEAIRTTANYFETHAQRMRYPEFRRQHLFVGSGVIEAGCKTVIGSRCKQSGMFWTVRAANAILALRCCHINGRFEDYWEAHRA